MILFALLGLPLAAQAFTQDGCGAGQCRDCHSLEVKEAAKILGEGVDRVHKVEFAEIPGFWVVEVEKEKQRFPLYVDFSKAYVVAGNVIRLKDGENVTARYQTAMNGGKGAKAAPPTPPAPAKKIDFSRIPLDDALLLGSPAAKIRVVVFTDPECSFCKKLHVELKEVVRLDSNVAFLIKMFPLKIHPNAYGIAKSVVCTKSLTLLEASFSGAPVLPSACETTKVDESLALGEAIGINSTPTLILPDGTLLPGYKKAADILRLLGSKAAPPG
ncbi:MAG: hypothetical protein A2091_07715 [Desulfuromonadales bacterium GWD2_61_12]|nr:MAG: hypothetical protein A2005_04250 [Desulfuromonadales bacterium GWC2_61_20]OGR35774.1 MAG: hypothetical protein A2091_07715 [Desulfuromonadales bacterium GWD2_61_12]